jgi:hypothetical protein
MKTLALICLLTIVGCGSVPRICIGSVQANSLACIKAPPDVNLKADLICPEDYYLDPDNHTVVCRPITRVRY